MAKNKKKQETDQHLDSMDMLNNPWTLRALLLAAALIALGIALG